MDKTEESKLLELQELALEHKSSKRQKSLEEKQMIVKAHLCRGHRSACPFCVVFAVCHICECLSAAARQRGTRHLVISCVEGVAYIYILNYYIL